MKKLVLILLTIVIMVMALNSCDSLDVLDLFEDEKTIQECNYGETLTFADGISVSVLGYDYESRIRIGYYNYSAQNGNRYLLLDVNIVNNSSETYTESGTHCWLDYNGTQIGQVDIVTHYSHGFYQVSQMPTTTKTYILTFELSEEIEITELAFVLEHENEQVKFNF